MKNSMTIQKHTNLVDEAILILYQWVNKDEMEHIKEEYRGTYQGDPDEYQKIWDIILEIYQAVKEKLQPKKDRIDYYFKSQNNNFCFNASFAFLWDYHNTENKLLPYEERVQEMTEEDRIKAYARTVILDDEDEASVEGLHTYEDFLKFLDGASCGKEEKWEILKIFHNQKEFYEEVTAILQVVVDLLEHKYSKQIAELELKFYDYWAEMQEKEGIIELVQKNLKVIWKENEMGTVLLPIIFRPNSVTFSTLPEAQGIDVLRIGILLDRHFHISGNKREAEDIVNIGKLLSDISKVDILKLTAKKPCYGKEIANELGLSTATISYHVSTLVKLGLLNTELSSKRVYYSLNYEKLSGYLENIKDYFIQG